MILCWGRSFFVSCEVISRHFVGREWIENMEVLKLGYCGCFGYVSALFQFQISSYSTCWIKRRRDMDVTWAETAVAAVLDMKVCLPLSHLTLAPLLIQALKLIRWDVFPDLFIVLRLQHLSASYFIVLCIIVAVLTKCILLIGWQSVSRLIIWTECVIQDIEIILEFV